MILRGPLSPNMSQGLRVSRRHLLYQKEIWVWQFRQHVEAEDDEEVTDEDLQVIIFATMGNLQHLGRANIWYGDVTFSVCPSLFYQLYTIHAEVYGQTVPLVYSLLPSKSRKCYKFMWLKLQELMAQREIHPRIQGYRSDLEVAPITTISMFTPESVATCFFHLAQAQWRKIQSLGLTDLYRENEEYSIFLRCFTAIAFVPEANVVVEYFNHLSASVPEDAPAGVLSFIEYIADIYVWREVQERAV